MLEMLKSKMMIGVAVTLLGIVFVNAGVTTKLEENYKEVTDIVIAMNLK